jgi:hypothetical protein
LPREYRGPIEREAIAHKPHRNVFAGDRAHGDPALILIPSNAFAAYWPARDMLGKFVRRFGSAGYCKLSSPRHSWEDSGASIPDNALTVDFERVTIDDGCLADICFC